jgi:hypothetical protein
MRFVAARVMEANSLVGQTVSGIPILTGSDGAASQVCCADQPTFVGKRRGVDLSTAGFVAKPSAPGFSRVRETVRVVRRM